MFDPEEHKHAVHIFGTVDDAVTVTDADMEAFDKGLPWDGPGDGQDGHSVPRFGYGSDGCTLVTWGKTQQQSWEWLGRRLYESCAVITADWLREADGLTPSGFPLDQLVADLKALA